MSSIINKTGSYRKIPFSEETPESGFFTYYTIEDLILEGYRKKSQAFKCRTIGVLKSVNGRFYLNDVEKNADVNSSKIVVSMSHLKTPVPNTVIPITVQLFGTLQWMKETILFVKIIQVLSPTTAIKLQKTINYISKNHVAPIQLRVEGDSHPHKQLR
ncbi:unnamed protein product [Leptosia nina]|uniref:Uncharacterized protein n=1 Tax=Leptosia nina TaxID=320188 RepID=A0AAV1JHP7_9NEOP